MNEYEVSDGVKEITITYKQDELDAVMLTEMLDFVLDCYNSNQRLFAE
jgi:hypothetical protein